MPSSIPPRRRSDPLAVVSRLTLRDRHLCSLLAEHYLLATEQVQRALFPSMHAAWLRLRILHRLDVLARFQVPRPTGPGLTSNLHTLGTVGLQICPSTYHDPQNPTAKAPRSSTDRAMRIAFSPALHHLLAVNDFFVDLLERARLDESTRLARWWSEQHATNAYGYTSAPIRPDGHGVWCAGGRSVGFFLEADRGTEPLATVLSKLDRYGILATRHGPRYPVLLWLPSRRREANLHQILAKTPTAMPVATAMHADNPADAVWTLATDPGRKYALHELPSDHGPADAGLNPNMFTPSETP